MQRLFREVAEEISPWPREEQPALQRTPKNTWTADRTACSSLCLPAPFACASTKKQLKARSFHRPPLPLHFSFLTPNWFSCRTPSGLNKQSGEEDIDDQHDADDQRHHRLHKGEVRRVAREAGERADGVFFSLSVIALSFQFLVELARAAVLHAVSYVGFTCPLPSFPSR